MNLVTFRQRQARDKIDKISSLAARGFIFTGQWYQSEHLNSDDIKTKFLSRHSFEEFYIWTVLKTPQVSSQLHVCFLRCHSHLAQRLLQRAPCRCCEECWEGSWRRNLRIVLFFGSQIQDSFSPTTTFQEVFNKTQNLHSENMAIVWNSGVLFKSIHETTPM